mgnify:CR=1 FL=1
MVEPQASKQEIQLRLWAKTDPYHSLVHHMVDVGCMGMTLLNDSAYTAILKRIVDLTGVDEAVLLRQVACLFAVHDLGKCHPLFQQKAPELDIVADLARWGRLQRDDTRTYLHETASGEVVRRWLQTQYGYSRSTSRLWHDILAQHHQRKGIQITIDSHNEPFWNSLQSELVQLMLTLFKADFTEEWRTDHMDLIGTLLSGLLILADWLASNREVFQPPSPQNTLEEYLIASLHQTQHTIRALGFEAQQVWSDKSRFSDYWPAIPPEKMRNLQQVADQWCHEGLAPGLLIIEAPMGEGKTETAVYIASHWIRNACATGMYIALPTAATSNQMYERVSSYLEEHSITNSAKLLHGTAWMIDDLVPEQELSTDTDQELARQWFQPLRRGLLAPWAVGTIDQVLMAALKVRFGVLRLLGLSCKVLVIDEVHAYDVYMTTILERLLNWCGLMGIPVILLSATLPSTRLKHLVQAYTAAEITENEGGLLPYPLITHVDTGGCLQRRSIERVYAERTVAVQLLELLNDWPAVADHAVRIVEEGGCLCIIVNTVREAQILYTEMKKRVSADTWTLLFHSRFRAGDRHSIENKCLRAFDKRSLTGNPRGNSFRPQKAILVATQVIEQSLDLDFDYMISALAPIDLILQRLGRHQRHEGRIRPPGANKEPFTVLVPGQEMDWGPSRWVYAPWILYRSLQVLREYEKIRIPQDVRQLVESVYSENAPEEDHPYIDEWKRMITKQEKDRSQAREYLLPTPNRQRFLSVVLQGQSSDGDNGAKWLRAQTRLGNDQCDLLVLEEADYDKVSAGITKMDKAALRDLMLCMVGVPQWWVIATQPAEGYTAIIPGQGSLSGKYLLGLDSNGFWKGITEKGGAVSINYDVDYGLIREEGM